MKSASFRLVRGAAPIALLLAASCLSGGPRSSGPTPLFPKDGAPEGWLVRTWSDLAVPAPSGVAWRVENGVLHGSPDRGTWLVSEREYGDFVLEYEFKLGPRGNSGVALRSPLSGDPAFDGLELQMVDLRYKPDARDSELTGALYRAIPPREQVYRPEEWNRMEIECRGPRFKAVLNGVVIQDLDLDDHAQAGLRHDGSPARPIRDRPRRGRIGFQELSRGPGRVQIRNARIRSLDR